MALAGIETLLVGADVRFVNLEGLLVESSVDVTRPDIGHKPNWRHCGRESVAALVGAGIDAVACANNVAFPGHALMESLGVLETAGVGHAGAGASFDEAHAPCVVTCGGVRVGLLAYSSIVFPFGHAAGATSPGIATLRAVTAYAPDGRCAEVPGRPPRVMTQPVDEDVLALTRDVVAARRVCDVVVVSVHWGLPGDEVCDYQRTLGRAAVDAGADVVMGHGPHSVHGVEIYSGRPIFYSLGNLAFDWEAMRGRHRDGLVALCRIDGGRLGSVELHAVRRDEHNDIVIATGGASDEILKRVVRLSPGVGDAMQGRSGHLRLELS